MQTSVIVVRKQYIHKKLQNSLFCDNNAENTTNEKTISLVQNLEEKWRKIFNLHHCYYSKQKQF